MINHSSYAWIQGALWSVRSKQNLARKTAEVALVILVTTALTGAWLAFFTFVPFDFTPPRPS